MRYGKTVFFAVFILFLAGGTAQAQEAVLNAVEEYLQDATDFLDDDDHKIFGKIRFVPQVAQRLVYDDNIFLNDDDEPNTEGREWDVISETEIEIALVMPVNDKYTKLWSGKELRLLSYEVRFLEYLHRGDVDSINQRFSGEFFGFLEDLISVKLGKGDRGFFFQADAEYKDVSDPLDVLRFEAANDPALPATALVLGEDLKELKWKEAHANARMGYKTNAFDVIFGYRFEWFDFEEDLFEQANHHSHTGTFEVGYSPPDHEDKRFFVRGEFENMNFTGDIGGDDILNDENIYRALAGFQGSAISKRFYIEFHFGLTHWDNQDNGLFGDRDNYTGGEGGIRVAFRPNQERKTIYQLEVTRTIGWSAISNFRIDHAVSANYVHEFIEKRLEGDVGFTWSHHKPSDGPVRTVIEAGIGAVYHLLPQLDVTLRYLYRKQISDDEIALGGFADLDNSGTIEPSTEAVFFVTDGDFFQHVVSLGFEFEF
jgi:hypothetical protein